MTNEDSKPLIGISIVNYYSEQLIGSLLHSLRESLLDGIAVVYIADNSGTSLALHQVVRGLSLEDYVTIVDCGGNLGYAAGNNRAIDLLLRRYNAAVVCVINPDVVVLNLDAYEVANCVVTSSRAVIWGAVTEEPDREPRPGIARLNRVTGTIADSTDSPRGGTIPFVYGNFFMVSSQNWLQLGGLNEQFFLYFEEPDLAVRAKALGSPIGVLERTRVRHSRGATVGGASGTSGLQLYHTTRSAILFYRIHFRRFLLLVVAVRLYHGAALLRRGNVAGARAILGGLFSGFGSKMRTFGN